ncbi:hypothetical protein HK57_00613 [Aspergillus ustus]|uniref:Secreted protein n=1 Tax=Aspergillus ustus TaxID=40382 RepID=A0A0C1EG28_ASPUT|nr:hypothetical protein HK57_00613 [Aspergillus ustus]
MLVKNILLPLGLLATLGLASPTPEAETDVTIDTTEADLNSTTTTDDESTLAKRGSGVWLDLYGSGSCSDSWRPQPQSGWVWSGQCHNFDGFTYGARAGAVDQSPDTWWDDRCTFKFWEGADCHGHATVHHLSDSIKWKNGYAGIPYPTYKCIATANKADGSFYLGNGAQSVLMTC